MTAEFDDAVCEQMAVVATLLKKPMMNVGSRNPVFTYSMQQPFSFNLFVFLWLAQSAFVINRH